MSSEPLYKLTGVEKEYAGPFERLRVLRGIDLSIDAGESVAILGASGSGKSTLLHIMGMLDEQTGGEVLFRGRDLRSFGEQGKAKLRNREIGFVFQFHHLLPEFSAVENVAMPGIIAGMDKARAEEMACEALVRVGLGDRLRQQVTTLSGGERQRAAIARAILLEPKVLLADEPTGNLDEKTGRKVFDLLAELNEGLGMTFVVVTHNTELAGVLGRRYELRAGELYAQQ